MLSQLASQGQRVLATLAVWCCAGFQMCAVLWTHQPLSWNPACWRVVGRLLSNVTSSGGAYGVVVVRLL